MNKAIPVGIAVAAAVAVALAVYGMTGSEEPGLAGEIRIGMLADTSGSFSTYGHENLAAAMLAQKEFNEYLEESGEPWSISIVHEDTASIPETALEKIMAFDEDGIGIVAGPETSSSIEEIMGYVDENDMMLFSCCSTAPPLAIQDRVFRLITDNTIQGGVFGEIFEHEKIEVIVPVWRGDLWGDGLIGAVRDGFPGDIDEGIRYDIDATNYAGHAEELAGIVGGRVSEAGAQNVAVLYLGFGEAEQFAEAAAAHDILEEVRWFGSDASTNDRALLGGAAGEFLEAAQFTTLQIASEGGATYESVRESVMGAVGREPSTFAHATYDTIWMIGLAIQEAQSADAIAVSSEIHKISKEYVGAIGSTALNEAGDLAEADYDIWGTRDGQWKRLGLYDHETGGITLGKAEVSIGVIVPGSGSLESFGTETLAATQFGATELNARLAESGQPWRITLDVEETDSSAGDALAALMRLDERGTKIVLWADSSNSLAAAKGYADENGMLLIACCSSAASLAIQGDSIFRMAADDSQLGAALARVLEHEGINAIVPAWRGDVWGDGLVDSLRAEFGGTIHEGVRYGADVSDFSPHAAELAGIVQDGAAVIYLGFDEAASFVREAAIHDTLRDARWFSAGPSTRADALVADKVVAEFLGDARFASLQAAPSTGATADRVFAHIREEIGSAPNAYAHSAYDAAWIAGLAIVEAGGTDPSAVAGILPGIAQAYDGALRSTALNAAGDIADVDYEVWGIAGGEWSRLGQYAAGEVVLGQTKVEVGMIAPRTGSLALFGEESVVATQFAVAEFNRHLEETGEGWRMALKITDTSSTAEGALDAIKELDESGIGIVFGAESSATTSVVKEYTDENGMLLVACCSSAPSLAIQGDSVFRMVPDDTHQAEAIARIFEAEGINTIVPVWRGDVWGDGLRAAGEAEFSGVMDAGIRYDVDVSEFSLQVIELAEIVQGYEDAAVWYMGFGEVLEFVRDAAVHDALGEARWFGSGPSIKETSLANDLVGGGFLEGVRYTTLQVAPSTGPVADRVSEHVSGELGGSPNSFSHSSYDAVWIAGLAISELGGADPPEVAEILPRIAEGYSGALDRSEFNESGDIAGADYEVWGIAGGEWSQTGRYLHESGEIAYTSGQALEGEITVGWITNDPEGADSDNAEAARLALADFNKHVEDEGGQWSMSLQMESIGPTSALDTVASFDSQGIGVVIGPENSGSIADAAEYLGENGMALISCCSTAPVLSADDGIFRLAPDDATQGAAIARILEHEGVEAIVIAYRDDIWGTGLHDAILDRYSGASESVMYDIDSDEFAGHAQQVAQKVQEYGEMYGNVAVVYLGFEEGADFIEAASSHDILQGVRWFGADASAKDPLITDNIVAAEFAGAVQFTAIQAAAQENPAKDRVDARIMELRDRSPDTYASSSYDAVWIAGLAIAEAGSDEGAAVIKEIPVVAKRYSGAIGSTALNESGDLEHADYDVWIVRGAAWEHAGQYMQGIDSLELN